MSCNVRALSEVSLWILFSVVCCCFGRVYIDLSKFWYFFPKKRVYGKSCCQFYSLIISSGCKPFYSYIISIGYTCLTRSRIATDISQVRSNRNIRQGVSSEIDEKNSFREASQLLCHYEWGWTGLSIPRKPTSMPNTYNSLSLNPQQTLFLFPQHLSDDPQASAVRRARLAIRFIKLSSILSMYPKAEAMEGNARKKVNWKRIGHACSRNRQEIGMPFSFSVSMNWSHNVSIYMSTWDTFWRSLPYSNLW